MHYLDLVQDTERRKNETKEARDFLCIDRLYLRIRKYEPEIVIETGVRFGYSTTAILKALEDNKRGHLYSIEYNKNGVGQLIPETLKERWTLILGDSLKELPKLVQRLGSVDFFFHDSNHAYEHQCQEFSIVYPYVGPGWFITADDWSFGGKWPLSDFAAERGEQISCLSIKPRFGVIQKRDPNA